MLGETFDNTGGLLAKNQISVWTNKTMTNLKFTKKSEPSNDIISIKEPPNRPVDNSVEVETSAQQDVIFRLANGSSNLNNGLPVPILENLCTLGEHDFDHEIFKLYSKMLLM